MGGPVPLGYVAKELRAAPRMTRSAPTTSTGGDGEAGIATQRQAAQPLPQGHIDEARGGARLDQRLARVASRLFRTFAHATTAP